MQPSQSSAKIYFISVFFFFFFFFSFIFYIFFVYMFPVKQSKRFWTEIILKQVTMQIISIFLQK